MCPLANNWPPQYYAPHYYAADLWSKVDIQHLMCPLANNWLSSSTIVLCKLIFGPKGGYSTF
jgi:hypothetical protein